MQLLSSEKISNHVNNIIHADTQLHQNRIDLTVAEINRPSRVASLDFGGSEFKPADTEIMHAIKKNPKDDYGWWELQSGLYQATFNESLSLADSVLAIISLHEHATEAGIVGTSHALTADDLLKINFQVPQCGCNIKENARFATAYFLEQ